MRSTEAERWDRDLRYQPWTLVGLTGVIGVIVVGMFAIGTVLSEEEARDYGYASWAATTLVALGFLVVIFWCEKRELWIFSQKLPAWRLLQGIGAALVILSTVMILAPFAPFGLRVKGIVALSGALAGLSFIKPLIAEEKGRRTRRYRQPR